MFAFISLLSTCPSVTADRFALRNTYGTVENRYHLTAYNCSDPTEVQAYSSVPARPCSIRTNPVQRERPTRFQLLQKEPKRYITAYSCFLSRTDIRYNCGVYGHPELDPLHWSFSMPQRVPYEQCLAWIWTRNYRPSSYSTMMHGRDLSYPISLNKPTYVSYMVHGCTYRKAPSLPTDQVSETACQGEWVEYEKDQPLNHMVAYYDELHLQTVNLMIEDGVVVDQNRHLSLPCPWETGQCIAEGKMFIWNLTEPDYCQVAVVKEFLGHPLYAKLSDLNAPQGQHVAEAIISSEVREKIQIRPLGPISQCGRMVTATKVEHMFLFPVMETDEQGDIIVDNRDRAFTRTIHLSEVDLRKYIANHHEYLYFDITSQAEKEIDTILHQDCLRRQDEARKAHFFGAGPPWIPTLSSAGWSVLHPLGRNELQVSMRA